MFGLAEQIYGDMRGVAAAVVDDQNFTRPGNHVNIHQPENQPFRGGDVDIPRPGDFVDPGYRRGSVRQGRNRLGATEFKDPVNSGNSGRSQHMGIHHPVGHGHHHDDFTHPGNLGRHCIHQHRRRITGLAARHVDADPIKGAHQLSNQHIGFIRRQPGLLLLLAMIIANALRRQFKSRIRFGTDLLDCGLHFVGSDFNAGRIQLQTIEFGGQLKQGRIAAQAHSGQNVFNRRFNPGGNLFGALLNFFEGRGKPGVRKFQYLDHGISLACLFFTESL